MDNNSQDLGPLGEVFPNMGDVMSRSNAENNNTFNDYQGYKR